MGAFNQWADLLNFDKPHRFPVTSLGFRGGHTGGSGL